MARISSCPTWRAHQQLDRQRHARHRLSHLSTGSPRPDGDRHTGGTQSQYVNPYASSWGYLDMDQIVPGGTPVDQYEAAGDNTAATAVALQPDDIYNFR